MRILVWQWSRFGGGPRVAALLAEGLTSLPDTSVFLSLSSFAEILRGSSPPRCDLRVDTYHGLLSFVVRVLGAPFALPQLIRRIRALAPQIAVCAQPGPFDLFMAAALNRIGIPFVVLVHDAEAHPGDGTPMVMWLQRVLCRRAVALGAMSAHVGAMLVAQKLAGTPGRPLIPLRLPPIPFVLPAERVRRDNSFHLLHFGRLRQYKGLDLLADSLSRLGPVPGLKVRVVGSGPECRDLERLRRLPGVTVENRWVDEDEIGALLAWSDALILPYREASQSGVAAAALAAGRQIVSTDVGGLSEQLRDEPLAILCTCDADSLTDGLRRTLERPRVPPETRADPRDAWRDLSRGLLDYLGRYRTKPAAG